MSLKPGHPTRASSSLERIMHLSPTKTLGENEKLADPCIQKMTWSAGLKKPQGKAWVCQTLTQTRRENAYR